MRLLIPILFASLTGHSLLQAADFDRALEPFFDTHCYECHDDVVKKGGLDLFELSTDLHDPAAMAKWVQIYDRVSKGEMPPEKEPRPHKKDIATFQKALANPLLTAHASQKGTVLRRLNREEYENTLNDMFGTNLRLAELLPEDGRSHEFSNVGESLGISMVQMQRYLESITKVIETAMVTEIAPPEELTITTSYGETRDAQKFIGKQWYKAKDGSIVFYEATGYPNGLLREAGTRAPGYYKVRITGYAYQSDEPVTMVVKGDTYARGADKPTYGYFSVPPGKPSTIEFETWMEDRYMLKIQPCGIYDSYAIKREGLENYKGPGLAIKQVELIGPLTKEYPSKGHKLLFDGLPRQEIMPKNPKDREKKYYRPKFEIQVDDPVAAAGPALERIATAAFRRPVEAGEIAPYMDLFQSELAQESTFEEAYLTAVKAIFCSPEFLYLREPAGKLESYALANRLSYALVRTAPDEELLKAADTGTLEKNPKMLVAQMDRLLGDPRSERMITDFTDAWLNLREIDFTSPDRKLFPEFDEYLQHSMIDETRTFFRELIDENLGIANFVRSDFGMLNERLAKHYEIDGVNGPDIRRVSLPAESVRGGFLSQGSVLKVSANGTNTSPVVRGVWVMERILGVTPPPPPPGIPGVEPDIRGASTLREILDQHRDSVSCKSCHQQIDPPGFALESFNPVGGWRDYFRSLGEGEKVDLQHDGNRVRYKQGLDVDATGELEGGRSFATFNEFRAYLMEDEAGLARAFTTKMLTYMTGREMGFSDRPEIERIVKEAASSDYGVRHLMELAVTSEIFRTK